MSPLCGDSTRYAPPLHCPKCGTTNRREYPLWAQLIRRDDHGQAQCDCCNFVGPVYLFLPSGEVQ